MVPFEETRAREISEARRVSGKKTLRCVFESLENYCGFSDIPARELVPFTISGSVIAHF